MPCVGECYSTRINCYVYRIEIGRNIVYLIFIVGCRAMRVTGNGPRDIYELRHSMNRSSGWNVQLRDSMMPLYMFYNCNRCQSISKTVVFEQMWILFVLADIARKYFVWFFSSVLLVIIVITELLTNQQTKCRILSNVFKWCAPFLFAFVQITILNTFHLRRCTICWRSVCDVWRWLPTHIEQLSHSGTELSHVRRKRTFYSCR